MSINRSFFAPRTDITWNGQEVCQVRGVTPNDIAQAVNENAGDVEKLMENMERSKVEAMRAEVMGEAAPDATDATKNMLGTVLTTVPDLAAKIIALACDEPDQADFIKNNYTLPLQFDILTEIAKLTFVDQDGFKTFLGNVVALVGNFNTKSQSRLAQ